jgi:hypothetical protein
MAFDLVFAPATFDTPTVGKFEKDWANIPDPNVRKVIAREHQYLFLHARLLEQLRHTSKGAASDPPYKWRIDYNLRAGFIKAALLVAASICEAALRAHAEKRHLPLHKIPKCRTVGDVLNACKGQADVAAYYADLLSLKDLRNNLHLFEAAASAKAHYMAVLKQEETSFNMARKLVAECMKLKSP